MNWPSAFTASPRYVAASVCLFFLLFGPKTIVWNFDTLGATSALAVVLWRRYVPRVLAAPDFWATVLAMAYVLLVLAATSVPDSWWALKPPRVLVNYLGVFGFVTWGLTRFGPPRMLLMLHNAILAHAVLILLMVLSPAFADFIKSQFGGVTKSTFQVSGLTRGLALSAIVMMFPFVSYPLFALMHGYRERGIALKLLVMMAATFFMGRTGFYLCVTASLIVVLALGARTRKALKLVVASLVGFGVLGALLVQFQISPNRSIITKIPGAPSLAEPIGHTLEPVVNYVRGRGLTARSVEHVMSMPVVYHNDTLPEMVLGTGLYGRGDTWTYLPTDVAYLHMFSAFGAVGVAVLVFPYLVPFPTFVRLRHTAPYWASLAIALMVVIANFKETALFTRNIYTVHVFFIAWLVYASHDEAAATALTDARAGER